MQTTGIVVILALIFIGSPIYSIDYSIPKIIELLSSLYQEQIALETKWQKTGCLDPRESIRYAHVLRDIEALEELLEILKGDYRLWHSINNLAYGQEQAVGAAPPVNTIKKIPENSKKH